MFTPRSYAVHAPALSLPEAAMLPALPRPEPTLPRNLAMPDRRIYHPMPLPGRDVDMVRRAALHHVKNAPTQRPGRGSPVNQRAAVIATKLPAR